MTELFLGVDIGTTNVKAVLATAAGQVVAQAQATYPTHHPRPGWAEQAPADWWQGTVTVIRDVLATPGVRPAQVAAIGVSGQGCAVTLIDAAGAVVRPAIIWMDTRAAPQCEIMQTRCGDILLALNGKTPAPYNADPVLMWLAQHEPKAIAAAQTSLTTTGYVNYRLTGRAVENVSDASILFAYDLKNDDWSEELIGAFGLPLKLYPAVAPCTEIIGGLSRAAAAETGLPMGIPVVAGGEDTSSAGLAIGVTAPGHALLSLGTAGTVYVVEAEPLIHPQLLAFMHVLPQQRLLGGSMAAVGGALRWIRDILGASRDFYALTELAAQSLAGAGGVLFLPYLSGELQPINDGHARGLFFGLNMSTTSANLVRAVMEGAAFAIAHNLTIAQAAGAHVTELRAVGGPTQSTLWCQIIANVTGRPVAVLEESAGAPLGNALLAAAGVGAIHDLAGSARAAAQVSRLFEPDAPAAARYAELFAIYTALYPQLQAQFAALAAIPDLHEEPT